MNETYPNKHEQTPITTEETQRVMGGAGLEAATMGGQGDMITGVPESLQSEVIETAVPAVETDMIAEVPAALKAAPTDREQLQIPPREVSTPASRRVPLGDIREFKGNPARAIGYDGITRR